MDQDEQRDAAEEKYNRKFCIPCGTSPCQWDGKPDGFHTDDPGTLRVFMIDLAALRQVLEYQQPPDRRRYQEPGAPANETGDST